VVVREQQAKGTINMKRPCTFPLHALALLSCLAWGACGDDLGTLLAVDASTAEAGQSPVPMDSGIDGGAAATHRGIAVVNSDYSATSVSFLDRDGNLVKDGCFHSGTGTPGLSMTLSGDVVLPTQMPEDGSVPIIDRGNGALTWLDPATCAPLRQLAVSTGYLAYPHDVVTLSASKAYVTRFEENAAATPAAGDFDDGSDLLIIDPAQTKIMGRIDLKPYAPAGVQPRADRVLLAEGIVFVSLNAISGDFKTYGTGRIVMVDPLADAVIGAIDLPGVKNCGAMTYLAAEKKLMVACGGEFSALQVNTSAIVVINLGVTPPAVLTQIAAASVGALPFSNQSLAAWDGQTVLGLTLGDPSKSALDQLWALPLAGTPPVKAFESAESWALGAVLADPEKSRVLVADGTTMTGAFLRIFDVAAGTFTPGKTVKTNPTHKLPPRALAWY
jgi:hypothetical protein